MSKNGNDEVGYGKPPVSGRFTKGRSGNIKGRPKGSKNLKTDLLEEFREQIEVVEGKRRRRVSKQRALIKAHLNKALKGDSRSFSIILNLFLKVCLDEAVEPKAGDVDLTQDELEIIKSHAPRLLRDLLGSETGQDESGAAKSADAPENLDFLT